MKLIVMLSILILTACSSTKKTDVVAEAKKLPAKTIDEKRKTITQMLDEHSEIKKELKGQLERTLLAALDRTEELRVKESQLIQQISIYTIVKKGSYAQLASLKEELKKVYQNKYENFDNTISRLKTLLGVIPANERLLEDARMDMVFDRFAEIP